MMERGDLPASAVTTSIRTVAEVLRVTALSVIAKKT